MHATHCLLIDTAKCRNVVSCNPGVRMIDERIDCSNEGHDLNRNAGLFLDTTEGLSKKILDDNHYCELQEVTKVRTDESKCILSGALLSKDVSAYKIHYPF